MVHYIVINTPEVPIRVRVVVNRQLVAAVRERERMKVGCCMLFGFLFGCILLGDCAIEQCTRKRSDVVCRGRCSAAASRNVSEILVIPLLITVAHLLE